MGSFLHFISLQVRMGGDGHGHDHDHGGAKSCWDYMYHGHPPAPDGTNALVAGTGIGGLLAFGYLFADWSAAGIFSFGAAGMLQPLNLFCTSCFVGFGMLVGANVGAMAIPDVPGAHGHH